MNPLRKLRKAKCWTQKEIAEKIGVKYQQYGYWERKPDLKDITIPSLMKIAPVFDTNVVGLLTERRAMRIAAKLGEN